MNDSKKLFQKILKYYFTKENYLLNYRKQNCSRKHYLIQWRTSFYSISVSSQSSAGANNIKRGNKIEAKMMIVYLETISDENTTKNVAQMMRIVWSRWSDPDPDIEEEDQTKTTANWKRKVLRCFHSSCAVNRGSERMIPSGKMGDSTSYIIRYRPSLVCLCYLFPSLIIVTLWIFLNWKRQNKSGRMGIFWGINMDK